jgi:hypothetical protein
VPLDEPESVPGKGLNEVDLDAAEEVDSHNVLDIEPDADAELDMSDEPVVEYDAYTVEDAEGDAFGEALDDTQKDCADETDTTVDLVAEGESVDEPPSEIVDRARVLDMKAEMVETGDVVAQPDEEGESDSTGEVDAVPVSTPVIEFARDAELETEGAGEGEPDREMRAVMVLGADAVPL